MQLIKKSALFALVLSSALICGQQVQAAKPSAAPAQETTLEVKAKLDAFAKSYVARANDTLKNNRQNMSVTKQGKGYVARYTEVDASTMTTEIYPGKGPGCEYVGHIVYLEKVYECTGKTISEAKTGTFTTPKARRIRELTRYDGKKWIRLSRINTGRCPDPWQGSALHPPGGTAPPGPSKKSTERPDGVAVRPFRTLQRRNGLRHIRYSSQAACPSSALSAFPYNGTPDA